MARRRPSALVVLGVYAGLMAAMAIIPVTIPLLYRLVLAENRAASAQLAAQTAEYGLRFDRGAPPTEGLPPYLKVMQTDGKLLLHHGELRPNPATEDAVCLTPRSVATIDIDGQLWTAACFENRRLRAFAIYPMPTRSYVGIGVFAVVLAVIAGLVTALGVLRLLRPLARLSHALDRVGTGERHVRMHHTGVREIDHLISRLNSAAIAVEQREFSILHRVQVVQEMARLVAHEVRNPLQSMELLTSLLADESSAPERRALTESIHAEIRTLDDVVTRLLREGATRGALQLHLVEGDLDALLTHVHTLRSPEATRTGARLELDLHTQTAVPFDRPLLSRSIENLVNNALRAVPGEGGVVCLRSREDHDAVFIHVEDNGPGIDPTLGEAVFEANVSGEGGNGLGLSLVRGVLEAHGGSANLESSDLGGAGFVLRLPKATP